MSSALRNQNMKFNNIYEALSQETSEAMSQATIEAEFPCLSTEKKTSKGKKVTKLVVPLKTYKEELREKYESLPVENLKTRMCNSIDKKEVCRHGENCRFAHSLDELVIRDCHFKDRCHFVKIRNGKLVNDGCNNCRNKHPQESKDDFIKRTGLSHYKTSAPKHEEINVDDEPEFKHEEINVDDEPEFKHEEINVDDEPEDKVGCSQNLATAKPLTQDIAYALPPTFKFGGPSEEKEIVLRVPKVLAMQALELALNSGNRCIRVEVIE